MSMSRRPFVALSLAEMFSISGTRLSTIAIPWLVLTTTGSAVLTGVVAFAELLPYVVVKALAGPLIDRIGPKRIAVTCDAASVGVVALVPALHALHALPMSVLLPIVFAMGVLRGPSDAAKQSLVPAVAELAAVPLERVTGVAGAIERLGSTVGAAAAGGLVALIGASQALTVNAVTFALAALIMRWGIPPQPDPVPVPAAAPGAEVHERSLTTYGRELRAGWDFLRGDAVLVGIVAMVATTNLLDQAWSAVLLPVWVRDGGYGAALLGLIFAVFSGASVLGAVVASVLGERLPRVAVYSVAFLVTGFPRFLVFVLDSPLAAVFIVLATGGFASGFINPILGAVIFERIPRPLVGRVSSLNTALCWALIPFGGLLGGALVAQWGIAPAMLAVGVGYLAATMFPLARRSFRQLGERPEGEPVGDDLTLPV